MSVFGRLSPAETRSWDTVPVRWAPRLMRGPLPRKSPPIYKFRNPRYRNQWIGSCVGQSGAATCETTIRTPDNFTAESKPNPPIDISPLWVYSIARAKSKALGVRLGREGAIVSHALQAAQDEGFVEWKYWPCTEETERAYTDRSRPQAAIDAPRFKPINQIAWLEEADQILEYMAGGYSVWIGTAWRGSMSTAADGRFEWGGLSRGGHATELLGYDLDADIVWLGNSWDGWGVVPGGWGYTSWTALSREFAPSKMRTGESEAVVFSDVDGWEPKIDILSWTEAL